MYVLTNDLDYTVVSSGYICIYFLPMAEIGYQTRLNCSVTNSHGFNYILNFIYMVKDDANVTP